MHTEPFSQAYFAQRSRSEIWSHSAKIVLVACTLSNCVGLARAQDTSVPVTVEKVEQRRVGLRNSFVGTAMPLRRSVVGSAVDGRVVKMFVREGDAVQIGKPLAQLRTETLEIELLRADAELDMRKQELVELENGSRPEEIQRAKARVEGAKALSDYTEAKLRRAREAYEKAAVVTLDELEEAISKSIAAKQGLMAAQAEYEMVLKGPRQEQIAQAQSRVNIQTEMARQIEDRISLHTLKAPFDGHIVARYHEVGGWASSGDLIVEIVELNPIEVEVFVSEQFVTHVEPGMKAVVTFDALPKRSFNGTVVKIVPQADVRSRTFPVKVQLPNPSEEGQPLIKAGMFARVMLFGRKQEAMVMVPKDSLVLQGDHRIVYVVQRGTQQEGGATVNPVSVELGISDGRWIAVNGNISPGQEVVVRGNERLRANQAVTVVP